jgi:hypothetical protein
MSVDTFQGGLKQNPEHGPEEQDEPTLPLFKYSAAQRARVTALYIVGPSSAGKTTLCGALAAALGVPSCACVREVARDVMRIRGFSRTDIGTLAMQQAIANAHVAADAAARAAALEHATKLIPDLEASPDGELGYDDGDQSRPRGHGLMLSDRCVLDAVAYGLLSDDGQNGRALLHSRTVRRALNEVYRTRGAHFVLLAPVADWIVDDGVRSIDNGACVDVFRKLLGELGIRYLELGESCRLLEERVASVRRWAWL